MDHLYKRTYNYSGTGMIPVYKPNGSIISMSMSSSAVDPLNSIKRLTGGFSTTSSVKVTLGGYTLFF